MTDKTASPSGLIYAVIPAIMAEIPSIGKDRKNTQQNYQFRGIDDVYNAINPILAKHGVFMRAEIDFDCVRREERPSKSGGTMTFVQVPARYFFVAMDGSFVCTDALGEGMDSGDKATPKALSVAQKYAILQMFCVPTAELKDVENDSPEPAFVKPEPITDDQRLVIEKLLDDKKRNMEDVDEAVAKVKKFYAIATFPGDLTHDQALTVIARWSKKAK